MSKFKKWWEDNFSLKKAVERSLEGTDFEGASFGEIFSFFSKAVSDKLLDTGMTQGQTERSETEFRNQQILNEEEWQRKLEWYQRFESPEAQVRQYKEAGLNPALLFGNGASVSASGGIGSAGSVSQASGTGDGLGAVLSGLLGIMNFGLQAKTVKSEIAQRRAMTVAQEIDNSYKARLNDLEIERRKKDLAKTESEIQINFQTVKKLVHETEFARIYSLYAPQLFDTQIKQGETTSELNEARAYREYIEASVSQARIAEINSVVEKNKKEVEQMDALITKINAEVYEIVTRSELNEQYARESQARIDKMAEEVKLIGKQIGLTEKDIQYYVWNHSKDISNNLGAGIKVHKEAFANDPKVKEWKEQE